MTRIIGIAGTAKNTGKTTTTTAIMENVYAKGISLGLTSIGYDGEDLDNVTRLPKPKVFVREKTLLAVTESCISAGTAGVEVIYRTDIRTALGKIVIGQVREPGQVVIAGPNKSSELRMVNKLLEQYGSTLILVDGALNRIAPMVETQGIIMATGASRSTEIEKIAVEARSIARLLNLSDTPSAVISVKATSLLNKEMVKNVLASLKPGEGAIEIQGIISEQSFQDLLALGRELLPGKSLILEDPVKLLVAGAPDLMMAMIERLEGLGGRVVVQKRVPLLAITINPFYPKYRFVSGDYEPAYIDKDLLKETLLKSCPVPVFNIVEEGVEGLWSHLGILEQG